MAGGRLTSPQPAVTPELPMTNSGAPLRPRTHCCRSGRGATREPSRPALPNVGSGCHNSAKSLSIESNGRAIGSPSPAQPEHGKLRRRRSSSPRHAARPRLGEHQAANEQLPRSCASPLRSTHTHQALRYPQRACPSRSGHLMLHNIKTPEKALCAQNTMPPSPAVKSLWCALLRRFAECVCGAGRYLVSSLTH